MGVAGKLVGAFVAARKLSGHIWLFAIWTSVNIHILSIICHRTSFYFSLHSSHTWDVICSTFRVGSFSFADQKRPINDALFGCSPSPSPSWRSYVVACLNEDLPFDYAASLSWKHLGSVLHEHAVPDPPDRQHAFAMMGTRAQSVSSAKNQFVVPLLFVSMPTHQKRDPKSQQQPFKSTRVRKPSFPQFRFQRQIALFSRHDMPRFPPSPTHHASHGTGHLERAAIQDLRCLLWEAIESQSLVHAILLPLRLPPRRS